jgi:hypothetical protein
MATRAPARPATSTAVVAQPLSNEDFMALLAQTGMISSGGGEFHRMSFKGGMLITDAGTPKEEQWPPTDRGRGPAMRVRIVKPPIYYNQFFCSEDEKNGSFDARKIGREDLNGKFLKKYDDPAEQAADQYANLDGYEQVSAYLNKRGKFTADIDLQIVPDSGELTGEEPVYTLSLSTTAALDFRGTTKNPNGGVVQDKNFIVQLGEFAMRQVIDSNPGATKQDLAAGVLQAMTALRLGGVVADLYIRQASSDDGSMTWGVPSFVPVFIDSGEVTPALPDPTTVGPEQNGDDDLPF